MKAAKTRREKGFAIVLTTLALTSTLLIAGLGFDVGTLYLIRTKLQGAMDAAALATVRALAQNPNTAAAQTVGSEFLTANFPNGYWGAQPMASLPVANAITISEIDKNGNAGTPGTTATAKLVTVTAGVTAPLYFLRILGQQTANISFTAQATRQGVLLMLVLDGSGSMQNQINGTASCVWAKNDAQAFLGYSQFDPDIDRIGLVTFGGNTYTVAPIANFQSPAGTINNASTVYTALNSFNCNGNTNTVEGLQQAYSAIRTFWGATQPSRANVVILMTDGAPNGFSADWSTQIKAGSNCDKPAGGPLIGYVARETPHIEGIFSIAPNANAAMNGTAVIGHGGGACAMDGNHPLIWNQDFTAVPPTDAYGDKMYGIGSYLPGTSSQVAVVDATPNDPAEAQFVALSKNAADGAGTRLRTDSTLRITIYSLGLSGNVALHPYDDLDPVLLQRIANVPASTSYDPTQPVGGYVNAPDASQLAAKFAQIASAIVSRLSQ